MRHSGTKRRVTVAQQLAWLITCVCITVDAIAGENVGRITISHLNGESAERGMCVQMTPAVPPSGWACLWKSNPLYKEITALLLTGVAGARTCKVAWTTTGPDGHPAILWAECY